MIARTNREAIQQGAIAERRKALFERYSTPKIRKGIIEVGNLAGDMYEEGGEERIRNLLKGDAVEVLTPILDDVYTRIINTLGSEAKTDLKAWKPTMQLKTTVGELDVVTDAMLNLFATYAFDQSTIISQTLTDAVLSNLADLIADSPEIIEKGPRAVARAIRRKAKKLSPFEAERIARTEVGMAYSEAQDLYTQEMWDEAEDGPLYKKWFSNRDKRTRKDHRKMNGRVVRQEDKFKMPNGDELRYPSDRRAEKASSIINCRCSYSSIPEELVPERHRRSSRDD